MPHYLTPEQQVQRLKNQIGWVTRLSASLSSTHDTEDIFSLILTGLLSPGCLGHDQVLFFAYEPESRLVKGRYALYHETIEAYQDLAAELDEETHFLQNRRGADTEPATPDGAEGTHALEAESLHWLVDNSSWILLSQRLPMRNPMTERLERMALRVGAEESHFLSDITHWRSARALCKSRMNGSIPPGLAAILPEHFAAAPLPSQSGLRGVLLVDRHLHPDSTFNQDLLNELDWFCRQAALALENTEMTRDLARTYEDLRQLDQLKTNFLSVISHELRTPLTSMSGFIDLILDEKVGPLNDNQRTLLTRVAKNTGHLAHLVNDLLEVAQTKAEGTVEVELRPVDPLEVLMNTIPKLEQRRRETDVEIEPRVETTPTPRILTDERALGRIFFHLLDNAMKFSPPGSVVEVNFRIEDDEMAIDVVDHGVGIPQEKIRRIFDQFYQVDNTLTRSFEGLGLGLAVSRILVQATHARILVRSDEGLGSTFTVIYPLCR